HQIACRLQNRGKHVEEERGIVDQQHVAWALPYRLFLSSEPIFEGKRQEVADIDDFGCLAADDGGTEHARIFARDLDVEVVLDNVDDLVDHQRHGAAAIGKHQQWLCALTLHTHVLAHADERHQMAAVLHHMAAVRQLDPVRIDLLKSRNKRQWDSLRLRRAGAEYQQRSAGLIGCLVVAVMRLGSDQLRNHRVAERLCNTVRINDHDHRSVAKDGVAGEHCDVAQLARHRLDHDFLGVEDTVNDDPERLASHLRDDDKAAVDIGSILVEAKQVAQADKRQQLVAQTQNPSVLDAFDAMLAAAAHAHQLYYRKLWNSEAVTACLNDQYRNNCERERNLDGKAQSCTSNRLHVNRAANLIDVVTHDVHSDAATGYAGDFRSSGKARRKYEFVDLSFR